MEAKRKELLDEITLRLGGGEEYGFVLSSLTRSYADGGYVSRKMRRNVAMGYHWRVIKHLLLNGSTLICATPKDSPDNVLGYILGDVDEGMAVVHYVYVKLEFRSLGIARHLLDAFFSHHALEPRANFIVTHMSSQVADFRCVQDLIYNPYLLMRGVTIGDSEPKAG